MTELTICGERELREQWQKTHESVHAAERLALATARDEINRRLGEMNQLREQITAERGDFLRRDSYEREHGMLRADVDGRLRVLENANSNLQGRLWVTGAAITIIVSIVVVAADIMLKLWVNK